MTNTTASAKPVKILVVPVEHFAGARHTRTTWAAHLAMSDDSEIRCGHERHPTTAAAIKCGNALWDRWDRTVRRGAS